MFWTILFFLVYGLTDIYDLIPIWRGCVMSTVILFFSLFFGTLEGTLIELSLVAISF